MIEIFVTIKKVVISAMKYLRRAKMLNADLYILYAHTSDVVRPSTPPPINLFLMVSLLLNIIHNA